MTHHFSQTTSWGKLNLQVALSLVIVVGFALSGTCSWFLYKLEHKAITIEFQKDVNERAISLYREVTVNLETLQTLAMLFTDETIPSFKRFTTEAKHIIKRHGAIQALEWVPRVPHAQRQSYEEHLHHIIPTFQFTERQQQGKMVRADIREEYFPVYYVAPLTANKTAMGFDLASNTIRRNTINQARATGIPQATAPITLVQERNKSKGFLAFLPLYQVNHMAEEDRGKKLTGFVLGVFRIHDVFTSSALSTEPAGIMMTLLDTTHNKQLILHNHHSRTGEAHNPEIMYTKILPDIWGRQWTLKASPTLAYQASRRSPLPITIGVIGLIFTTLIAFYIYYLAKRTIYIEQRILAKTYELNNANKHLKLLAQTDGLTGVANRRFMDQFIATEWKRHSRNKQPMSFIFIDIDFFKLYNDNYGHPAGDQVLKKVAKTLQNIPRRPGDLIARYGGEEFAIILSETAEAKPVALNCLRLIEELQVPHLFSEVAPVVTISIGFSTTVPTTETHPETLIKSADEALYRAKGNGRNQAEPGTT